MKIALRQPLNAPSASGGQTPHGGLPRIADPSAEATGSWEFYLFCFVLFILTPSSGGGILLCQALGGLLPLQNENFFRTCLTVLNDAVAWDIDGTRDPRTCIDLDPCEMYQSCPIVDDPLREVG